MPAASTHPRLRDARSFFMPAAAALVVLTVVAHLPAVTAPFLFDDTTAIDHNGSITRLWPPTTALHPPAESPVAGRPVSNYSLAINHGINRLLGIDQTADPGGPHKTISYHIVNIMLHLASGMLLLGIVRATLRRGRLAARWRDRADPIALAIAGIWLLHPLQTETVDYLAQRTELLVSCCYLATLYCSIRAWDAVHPGRWYVAGVLACALGMGAKEVMVSAPLILILYDRAFRLERWRDLVSIPLRARLLFHAGAFATLLVLAGLVTSAQRSSAGFNSGMSWAAYLNSQGWAIPHYLRLALWPAPLTLDYGYTALPLWRGAPGLILLLVIGMITLFAWARANRWGWLGFCGAWFFAILAPSSSVVPIATEIAAERRVYLALAAVIAVAVVASVLVVGRATRAVTWRIPVALLFGVLALCTVLTWRQSARYRDPEALWRATIDNRPANARAWNNLGQLLADRPSTRPVDADSFFRRAVQLDSSYVPALFNLATSAISRGDLVEAERLLRRVTTLQPDDEAALVQLGGLLLLRRDVAAALPLLERAVTLAPHDPAALVTLGMARATLGRTAEAEALFRQVLQIDPGNDAARAALAKLATGGA